MPFYFVTPVNRGKREPNLQTRQAPIPPSGGASSPAPLAPAPRGRYIVVTNTSDYRGGGIYVRRTTSRGRGPYFQLVRSYREEGKVKQEVLVHLGTHEKPEDALAAWPSEAEHLRQIGRGGQADKLEANLDKLRTLTEAETGDRTSGSA